MAGQEEIIFHEGSAKLFGRHVVFFDTHGRLLHRSPLIRAKDGNGYRLVEPFSTKPHTNYVVEFRWPWEASGCKSSRKR